MKKQEVFYDEKKNDPYREGVRFLGIKRMGDRLYLHATYNCSRGEIKERHDEEIFPMPYAAQVKFVFRKADLEELLRN